jgi:hypothetical protein
MANVADVRGGSLPGRLAVVRTAASNRPLGRALLAFFLFTLVEWGTWIAVLVWAYAAWGLRGASLVVVAQLVPSMVLTPPLAVLLSRLSRGRALVLGYVLQGGCFTACGVALATGAPTGVVTGVAAVACVAVGLTRPVHNAVVPRLCRTPGELAAGNAGTGTAEAVATFLGPAAGGALIVPVGPGGVLVVLGVADFVAALLVLSLGPSRLGASDPDESTSRPRLVEVLRDPTTRLVGGLVGAENVLVGMADILLVLLALDVLGMADSGPGLLNSALGLGGLVGAAAALVLMGRRGLTLAVVGGGLVAGAAFAIAGLSSTATSAFTLVCVCGAGKVFFDVACRTLVQRLVPERTLMAAFGLQEGLMDAGLLLGAALAPLAVTVGGPRGGLVLAGVLLPVVVLLAVPALRRLDRLAVVPVEVLDLLWGVPMLAVLSPRLLERLALESEPRTVAAGVDAFRQGEPGDRFYVVADGEVEVSIDGRAVRRLGRGGWFGELALLRSVPRSATVTALTPVTAHTIDRETFLATVARVPRATTVAATYARNTYEA